MRDSSARRVSFRWTLVPSTLRPYRSVTWRRAVAAVTSAPATLSSAATGSTLTLTFGDLTGMAGAGQRIVVRPG